MEELITLKQLKNYDKIKGSAIETVDELPTNAESHFYAKKHSYTTDKEETKTPIDLVGSYFRLVSNGKYTIRDMYKVVIDDKEVKSIFISNFVVSLYADDNFSGLYPDVLNSQTQYEWQISESVEHFDFYAGNSRENTFVQLANYEQVDDFFIRKTEKGSAGGVATLDADGRIPIEQMNVKSLRLIGTYDCSSGFFPSTVNRVEGDYYRVSVGGTLTEMRDDMVVKANNTISTFEKDLINYAMSEGLKIYIDIDGVKTEIMSVKNTGIVLADEEITLPTDTDIRLYADTEFPFSWNFEVGDFILYNDNNEWQKLSNQDSVQSVNGKSGDVTLNATDLKIEKDSPKNIKEYIDDEAGKVNTVNNINPDSNKNITIKGTDIKIADNDNRNIKEYVDEKDILKMTKAEWEVYDKSKLDDKQSVIITDDNEIKDISTMPIGGVVAFAGDKTPQGFLICDGNEYRISDYPELYEAIGDKYGRATSGYFRVPDYRGRFLEGSETVGDKIEAGLPNITGSVGYFNGATTSNYNEAINVSNGVFSGSINNASSPTQNLVSSTDTLSADSGGLIKFDASRSNSIYGKSTTVQPPSYTVMYIIRATNYMGVAKNAIDDTAVTNSSTWSAEKINNSLLNFIKIGVVRIATKNYSNSIDLTSMVVIPNGYKFLCWYYIASDGFVMDKPIYFANPSIIQGFPYTDESTIPRIDNTSISCYYLLIRA